MNDLERRIALYTAIGLAAVTLTGLAVALGTAFAPWLGWAVLAAVAGALAVALGRRAMDERTVARDRDLFAPTVEPYSGPDGPPLSIPDGYRPGP